MSFVCLFMGNTLSAVHSVERILQSTAEQRNVGKEEAVNNNREVWMTRARFLASAMAVLDDEIYVCVVVFFF